MRPDRDPIVDLRDSDNLPGHRLRHLFEEKACDFANQDDPVVLNDALDGNQLRVTAFSKSLPNLRRRAIRHISEHTRMQSSFERW